MSFILSALLRQFGGVFVYKQVSRYLHHEAIT